MAEPTHIHEHHHGAIHNHEGVQAQVTADNARRVAIALCVTIVLMVVEVAGGILSGSLALLADAGHMLADAFSLGLAFVAFRLSSRPADVRRSFGYHRFQVLAAFVNGALLLAIVGWVVFEAGARLFKPAPISGGLMLAVAFAGLAANIIAALVLHGGDRHSLNMRAAFLHVMGDLLGSVGAILAAGIILLTGWLAADAVISIVISGLVLVSAWRVLQSSGHILMEGTPLHLNMDDIRRALLEDIPGVEDIHHVHLWSLTEKKVMATLHARLAEGVSPVQTLRDMNALLARRFGIDHATIQIESGFCADHAAAGGTETCDKC
jgi:cobalt-zinc-cadmium efflux system protein